MRSPLYKVRLEKIVGTHPYRQESSHELGHGLRGVVDPLEENGLASQGNAGIGEPVAGLRGGGGDLVGVVEMGADVERVKTPEEPCQSGGDPLRRVHGVLVPMRMIST